MQAQLLVVKRDTAVKIERGGFIATMVWASQEILAPQKLGTEICEIVDVEQWEEDEGPRHKTQG